MIDAKSVREGICVKWKADGVAFDVSVALMLQASFWAHIHCGDIVVIPLTPEILEKCGFEYEDLGNDSPHEWWIHKEHKRFQLWDFNGEHWILAMADQYGLPTEHFKYLHQLQNIYFALTNTELNINL